MVIVSKVLLLAIVFGIVTTVSFSSAYASSDFFLKIDGINGESNDDKHKGEIDIQSFSWGVSNAGSMASGGGAGAGKASFQDFHFTKTIDKSSPLLFQAMATGEHIKEAKLMVRKAGSTPVEYLTITLSDILVSSISASGNSNDQAPIEELSLNFSKIEMEYQPIDASGKASESSIKASWNLKENVK
jgi:type VI secretion system secreted protein Hcp